MANTLNLGTDGNWGTKEGSVLGYNSENGNFKPLPFNFTRATSATRVNKEGLIETVGANEPRIDYKDNSKGAMLLEPSSTNLVTYSEDLSDSSWNVFRGSVTSNVAISPDGTLNADKLNGSTDNNTHYTAPNISYSLGSYSASIFAKKGTLNYLYIWFTGAGNVFDEEKVWFDLENGTIGTTQSPIEASIEEYGNGWYRCTAKSTADVAATGRIAFGISNADNVSSFTGTVNDNIYLWGAQVEVGSYATSYIPTSGSAVTRVADSSSQTVPDGVIGQTEGTIYIDVDFDTLSGTNMFTSIRPDGSNKIEIYRSDAVIYAEFASSNSFNFNKPNVAIGRYKIAVAYSSGSSSAYINGVLIGSNTANFSFTSTLNEIYINSRVTSFIEQSNYNEVKLYNTRLSNAELQALTQ